MNRVREGILNRPVKQDYGRNQTTLDTQFNKDKQVEDHKKEQHMNVHEHRRAVFDGSRVERHELQNNQKKEIDFLNEAKKCFNDRNEKLNQYENAKNYKHFLEAQRREEQARAAKREYEKQMTQQNRKMIEENQIRLKFEKQYADLQETEMIKTDFNKKSYDYR